MAPEQPAPDDQRRQRQAALQETIDAKATRKLKARREQPRDVWFGLGMFGLVGWSVALPTLLGIGLGIWVDMTWPGRFSWTLMLMGLGVILGCVNAWYWITREGRPD